MSRSSPRRTSNVPRQHRRLERRWIAFALAGIAALVAFVIAAWKFGGTGNEAIPNLGTTTDDAVEEGAAAGRRRRSTPPTKPVSFRLYVRAVDGNCWMEVRNWSASGKTPLHRHGRARPVPALRRASALGQLRQPREPRDRLQRPRSCTSAAPGLVRLHAARLLARGRLSRPRGFVVVTGSELVRGDRRDLNGPFLASELLRLGARAGADRDRRRRPGRARGGAARGARGRPLLSSPAGSGRRTTTARSSWSRAPRAASSSSTRRWRPRSRRSRARSPSGCDRPYADFAPGVRKQATLPEGAVVVGLAGTAPALVLETERGVVVVLPGPPRELRRLWPRGARVGAGAGGALARA